MGLLTWSPAPGASKIMQIPLLGSFSVFFLLLPRIAQVLFNVMAKNFRGNTNDAARAESKSKSKRQSDGKTPQERKTAKLQSETV